MPKLDVLLSLLLCFVEVRLTFDTWTEIVLRKQTWYNFFLALSKSLDTIFTWNEDKFH